jgi:uncharacterized protein YjdB
MKQIIYFLAAALFSSLALSCSKDDGGSSSQVDVSAITITGIPQNDTIPMLKGEKFSLGVVTEPANAPVRYYSSAGNVFSVNNETGEITALAGGIGTVIVTAPNGEGWTKAYCRVEVSEHIESIALASGHVFVVGGESNIVQPVVPSTVNVSSYFSVQRFTATNKSLIYESSDPAIATVSPTGVVTSVSKGTVQIRAKAAEGDAISQPITVYSGYSNAALSTTGWTATASSVEPGNSYRPQSIFSTSTGSFWHANWSAPLPPPLYLQVDMTQVRTFNEIELTRRSGYADTRDVEIYVTPEDVTEAGVTWTDQRYVLLGKITFGDEPSSVRSKILRLFPEGSVSSRYIMMKFPNSNRNINTGDQSLQTIYVRNIQ